MYLLPALSLSMSYLQIILFGLHVWTLFTKYFSVTLILMDLGGLESF